MKYPGHREGEENAQPGPHCQLASDDQETRRDAEDHEPHCYFVEGKSKTVKRVENAIVETRTKIATWYRCPGKLPEKGAAP